MEKLLPTIWHSIGNTILVEEIRVRFVRLPNPDTSPTFHMPKAMNSGFLYCRVCDCVLVNAYQLHVNITCNVIIR